MLMLAFLPCLRTHPFSLQTKPRNFSAVSFDLVTIFPGPCLKFQSHPNVIPVAGKLRQLDPANMSPAVTLLVLEASSPPNR